MTAVIKGLLNQMLRRLRLPAFVAHFSPQAALAANEGWSYDKYLQNLCEIELSERQTRKSRRLLIASKLPSGKTLSGFDRTRLPAPVNRKLDVLLEGDFLERRENVLAFGNPGSGKTHLIAALGQELALKGKSVFFTSCSLLVQKLLKAKADLILEKELRRLDKFDGLIIDDIGYVQQTREEMEVLFTLLAHRYEHRSVLITSNLVFSQWEKIFKDPMTTAAAIDRLVHHSIILELNLSSYRMATAQKSKAKEVTGKA
jgi:DNA replication protein DnaC